MKKSFKTDLGTTEVIKMMIGGVEQGMIIGSAGEEKPVILHIHGGPGMPDYALFREYGVNLNEYYTVCWWEQRGAGISNVANIPPESITLDQLIADTVEVTQYLMERFHKEKIYLMGHSWGSFLALNVVARYPELYEAYIAIGQMANQKQSELKCFEFISQCAYTSGNEDLIRNVEKFKFLPLDEMAVNIEYLIFRTDAINLLGAGFCHSNDWVHADHDPLEYCQEYTPDDISANREGLVPSVSLLWPTLIGPDLKKQIPKIEIPVYMIHGAFDKQVAYELTKDYFYTLEAPEKEFYTFENSAHYPHLEEKVKFLNIIHDSIIK